MEFKFNYNVNQDGTVKAYLKGELDTASSESIQANVDKMLEECSSKQITIDCSQLNYIASSGLRLLITIHKKTVANGGHMILVGVNKIVMSILNITTFDNIFDIQ